MGHVYISGMHVDGGVAWCRTYLAWCPSAPVVRATELDGGLNEAEVIRFLPIGSEPLGRVKHAGLFKNFEWPPGEDVSRIIDRNRVIF